MSGIAWRILFIQSIVTFQFISQNKFFLFVFLACLPLSQSHRGNVFKHVDGGAVVEQQEDPQEARGGRGGEERPGRH